MDATDLMALESLLVLLRKHNVIEFSDVRGYSLRLAVAPVTAHPAASADGPKPAPAKPVAPELQAAFDRLPEGYKRMFEPA